MSHDNASQVENQSQPLNVSPPCGRLSFATKPPLTMRLPILCRDPLKGGRRISSALLLANENPPLLHPLQTVKQRYFPEAPIDSPSQGVFIQHDDSSTIPHPCLYACIPCRRKINRQQFQSTTPSQEERPIQNSSSQLCPSRPLLHSDHASERSRVHCHTVAAISVSLVISALVAEANMCSTASG